MSTVDRHEATLRDLRIFLAICETGNLSKAGERLEVSQPSLSRTIRHLEYRFRLRLFERNGRGVVLTTAGVVLRDNAMRVVAAADDLDRQMAALPEMGGTAS